MKNKDNKQSFEQALELLPLYALGLLGDQKIQFVEKSLQDFPELQMDIKAEREMVEHLHEEKQLFSLSAMEDREIRLEQLLKREEFQVNKAEQQETIMNKKFTHFFQKILSGVMNKPQYMGFAAISTLSIATLIAFTVPQLEYKSTFQPAAIASEGEIEKNTLLIGLSVAPDDDRLLKILNDYNVKTTTIAGKNGMYRLSFTKDKPNAEDLKKLLSTLSNQAELVWFVGEAY